MKLSGKRKNHEKPLLSNGGLETIQSLSKGSKQSITSREEVKTTRRRVIKRELYSPEYVVDGRSTLMKAHRTCDVIESRARLRFRIL